MHLKQIWLLLLIASFFISCGSTEGGGGSGGGSSGTGGSAGNNPPGGSNTGGAGQQFTGKTITSNEINTYDGYGYEFWKDGGTGSMTLGNGGTFKCTWNSRPYQNILFRRGRKFNPVTQTHQQIGNISFDYTASWNPQSDGVSYLCVYGWTRNPSASGYNKLVEYYIVDDWGPYNKPPNSWEENRALKGTIAIDGGIYDIYTSTRTNKPSIDGNTNFMQYWSVRQTRRSSGGVVSVSEHFKKWEELGMPLGFLYEAALTIEGFNSSGSAEITKNILTIAK